MEGGLFNPRTVEEVFGDFKGRRNGLIKALTTEVEDFYRQCHPGKENLCLYGLPSEQWEVNLPAEEVPPELPEPALGINFARDSMQEKDWLSLVAVHSDAWLLAVAFYFGSRFGFDKADRKRLFNMINELPTVFEVVTGAAKKQQKEKSSVSNHSSNKSKSNSKPQGLESQEKYPKSQPEYEEEEVFDEESSTSRPPPPSPISQRRQGDSPGPSPRPPRPFPPRVTPEVVDLEDDSIPPVASIIEDFERCHLVPSIVGKYRGDVEFDEGMKALELLTLKTLSVARGLSLQGMDESHKMAGLVEAVGLRDKKLSDAEVARAQVLKERDDARLELRKAQDEIGIAKDEAKELKLELEQLKRDMESKIEGARVSAIEDFEKSEEMDRLKGEYTSGSYLRALKEA
ncbi:uncharacterized protein LOC111405124 isoform X2 [Olea europaea var. sylvestris]|uniref:uncharacterized protein LOC111405124 isoform X2 n=1 Tax=Olea europaea var. sylvestris TaxID=158386 RepID=UPI000C1D767E|nr:uncharacterized protein LOC111405124 isoform X2 [Olea europaea var. sylvestris]